MCASIAHTLCYVCFNKSVWHIARKITQFIQFLENGSSELCYKQTPIILQQNTGLCFGTKWKKKGEPVQMVAYICYQLSIARSPDCNESVHQCFDRNNVTEGCANMQEKLLRVILCLFKSLASVWGNCRFVEVFVLRV